MKKRTRIVAWIFMIFSMLAFIAGVFMGYGMMHGYNKSSSYTLANIYLWGLQWPFWILLLKQRKWAWFPIIVACTFLCIHTLYNIFKYNIVHPETNMHSLLENLILIVYNLIITVLPLWILITDRSSIWKIKPVETSSIEENASETV